MPATCCVPDCGNRGNRDKLSFYLIPSITDTRGRVNNLKNRRRQAWLKAIGRSDLQGTKLKYARVCSQHFVKGKPSAEDCDTHPDWVPSLNMSMKKTCLVPICENNSITMPDKYYIRIPNKLTTRRKWFEALDLHNVPLNSTKLYVCEDHFSLEDDCVNWMFFKTIGTKLQLKKGIVPHRNVHEITNVNPTKSQVSESDKKRKQMIQEQLKKSREIEFVSVDNSNNLETEETVPIETEPNRVNIIITSNGPIEIQYVQSNHYSGVQSQEKVTENQTNFDFDSEQNSCDIKVEPCDDSEIDDEVSEKAPLLEYLKVETFEEEIYENNTEQNSLLEFNLKVEPH